MGWFSKKKEDDDMDEEDLDEEDLDDDSQEQNAPDIPKGAAAGVLPDGRMVADVEMLKARMEASKEMNSAFNERISRLREDIGQLRNMLTEQEKQMQELELQATKAVDLVQEVQPQQIFTESKRAESKIEALRAKLESVELMNETLRDEMKGLRQEIKKVRTMEQTFELNKDVRAEILQVKKNVIKAGGDVSKIQEMYMQTKKKFVEFEAYKQQATRIEAFYQETKEEIEKMKMKTGEIMTKTDLDNAVAEILDKFTALTEETSEKISELAQFRAMLNKYEKLLAKRDESISWLHKETSKIKTVMKTIPVLRKKIEGNNSAFMKEKKELKKKIKQLSDRINKKEKEIQAKLKSINTKKGK